MEWHEGEGGGEDEGEGAIKGEGAGRGWCHITNNKYMNNNQTTTLVDNKSNNCVHFARFFVGFLGILCKKAGHPKKFRLKPEAGRLALILS